MILKKMRAKKSTWLETVFIVHLSPPAGKGFRGLGGWGELGGRSPILDITGMLVMTFRGENVDSCIAW